MTRVNLIPVEELMDQHLVAEYRELPMVPASLNRTLNSKAGFDRSKISDKYTLNKGHVYFFYDKGLFLLDRYYKLVREMQRRGMNPDLSRKFPCDIFAENELFWWWEPNEEEIQINRDRILLRISQRPNWYRKTTY